MSISSPPLSEYTPGAKQKYKIQHPSDLSSTLERETIPEKETPQNIAYTHLLGSGGDLRSHRGPLVRVESGLVFVLILVFVLQPQQQGVGNRFASPPHAVVVVDALRENGNNARRPTRRIYEGWQLTIQRRVH